MSGAIAAFFKSALLKLAALLAATMDNLALVMDTLLARLGHLIAQSELGQAVVTAWLSLVWNALLGYWVGLLVLLAAAMAVVGLGHLPLVGRALVARRRAVFVSFQHQREGDAARLGEALQGAGFKVLRVPYVQGAGHQQIVSTVNDLLRQAHAVVCLPGADASFVESEVAAATVAYKPVVFLLSPGGTLPNTADKRHPVFDLGRAAARNHQPLTDFVHHITQDYRSARVLYRSAWAHPAVGVSLAAVASALLAASAALFIAALLQGSIVLSQGVTAAAASTAALPAGELLRWRVIFTAAVPLLIGSMALLPIATWFLLVLRALVLQLRAARRAALRAAAGQFARADWVGVIPELQVGQPLYDCLLESAPKAHHEAQVQR